MRDASEGPVRALFLDPDAMLDAARIAEAWRSEKIEADPAKAAFVNAVDKEAVARLNQVLDRVPDLTVVVASHWLLLWSVTEIAQMLQGLGFRGRRFSRVHVEREAPATKHVGTWLKTWRDCGREVRYAVWATEVPAEHVGHLAVGAPRTAQLLVGDPS